MFVYEIVRQVPDLGVVVDRIDPERGADILAAMELRGMHYCGPCVRRGLREELQGHPVFDKLAGPMFGGFRDGRLVVRYEGNA